MKSLWFDAIPMVAREKRQAEQTDDRLNAIAMLQLWTMNYS
jgi:hypothetical protein